MYGDSGSDHTDPRSQPTRWDLCGFCRRGGSGKSCCGFAAEPSTAEEGVECGLSEGSCLGLVGIQTGRQSTDPPQPSAPTDALRGWMPNIAGEPAVSTVSTGGFTIYVGLAVALSSFFLGTIILVWLFIGPLGEIPSQSPALSLQPQLHPRPCQLQYFALHPILPHSNPPCTSSPPTPTLSPPATAHPTPFPPAIARWRNLGMLPPNSGVIALAAENSTTVSHPELLKTYDGQVITREPSRPP